MKVRLKVWLALLLLCAVAGSASAALKVWNGGASGLWDTDANWAPTGAPTTNDTALVTNDMVVVRNADGACHTLIASNGAYVVVNDAAHTLRVVTDAHVSGASAQLRSDAGLFDVGGTIFATNGGAVCLDGGSFKAGAVQFGTGTLIWHSGTLQLTESLNVAQGTSLQAWRVLTNQYLLLHGEGLASADLFMESSGVLTLAGGTIECDGLIGAAGMTLNLYDGSLIVNGSDFTWGSSPVVFESDTPGHSPSLVLDGFYFPSINADVLLATGAARRASLTLRDMTHLAGNATIAGGAGARADVLVTDAGTHWQPTTLTIGSSGSGGLVISNSAIADSCQELHLARNAGSTGTLVVAAGSSWSSYWQTHIGERGRGIVSARNGGSVTFNNQNQNTVFGEYAGAAAHVDIIGAGSSLSVAPAAGQQVQLGLSGAATLVVSNGGQAAFTAFTQAGVNAGGRGDVIVTGPGSLWQVNYDVWFGYEGMATLQVLNGGTTTWTSSKLGEFPGGVGVATVSGAGSYWHGGGDSSIGEEFMVGRYGLGTITVTSGGVLESSGYSNLGSYDGSGGKVTVSGAGSVWNASGNLSIGDTYNQYATGTLTIAYGGRVAVGSGVVIGNSGTLQGDGGTLQASVDNVYGRICPGTSIGMLTIDGVLAQEVGGTLHMELGGPALTQYDRLIVTGASTLAGTLLVTLASYTPTNGAVFDLFDWVGGTLGAFDTAELPALDSGLHWSTNTLYTTGELRVIPEPAGALLALVVVWARRRCAAAAAFGASAA